MLQTRSGVLLVAQVNTAAGGGSAVVVTNSQNLGVNVQNSAGWVVYVANTVAGGSAVSITNSGGLFAMQSGTWTVGISGTVSIANTSPLVSIQNSAGWVVNVANTANRTVIVNNSGGLFAQQSGSWVVTIANTGGTTLSQTIANTAGWIVAISNTSPLVSVQNTAGWVVNVANTSGLKAFATLETAQMSSNGVALTAGYAVINASGTNNTLVSAVATRKIRVLAFNMMTPVGVNAQFQSGTGASNLLTGTYFMASNGGLVADYNPVGWFETSGNNLLNLKLSAAQSVGGCLTYLEI